MTRWIGIDYGTRRIGVAVSDFNGKIASPAAVLHSAGPALDAQRVLKWANEHEATGIVVGLPVHMDGRESRQTQITRTFINELQRSAGILVEVADERLSSFQADEALAEMGETRPAKGRRDALAAQVILQSFLDARAQ
jgi:putative holliday junction resolvase